MNKELVTTHRVRSYELDSFGHVNNAVFLNYLEYARVEYLLQRGLTFNDFQKWNAVPYVVKAEISYKSPARVHDTLDIKGKIIHWRRSSFVLHYLIENRTSGKKCAQARLVFTFVDRDEHIVPIPHAFRTAMSEP